MEQPIDNSPSYEQLASECCAMARVIETIRTALAELGTTPNTASLSCRGCYKAKNNRADMHSICCHDCMRDKPDYYAVVAPQQA